METSINFLAVLVAGIAGTAIGALWYSPMLFGKMWMSLSKVSQAQIEAAKKKGMAKQYILSFVGSLITAFVIALIAMQWDMPFFNTVKYALPPGGMGMEPEPSSLVMAFSVAFWLWLGFIVPTLLSSVLWEKKPVTLYMINIGHHLVSFFVMATIVVFWN